MMVAATASQAGSVVLVITVAWWHVPALFTILALTYGLWPRENERGPFGGIGLLFRMLCVCVLVAFVWAIAGVLK